MVQEKNESKPAVNEAAKEHWKKGNSLFESGSFEESVVEFDEAIKIDSRYADAHFNRALAERILKNFAEAKASLERVMELQPSSADAPLLYGDILEVDNDILGARDWYSKALKINPDYVEAKSRMEHISSLIKTSSGGGAPGKAELSEENVEVVQDGQIKRVAFYKSHIKFDSVIGLKGVKRYLHENVVLAIERPDLFKKYGKRLGVGLLLYGPPGVGKCVTEDTLVLLPGGRCEPIKTVVENREPYVLTLTEDHKLVVKKVEGWWKLDGKPLLKITTQSGREIKCTPEHPFLIRGGWTHAVDLEKGTRIGVPRYVPVFGNTVMRECEVKLLAYFISEGTLTQGMPLSTNVDLEMLEDFQSAVKQFDSHFNKTGREKVVNIQVCGSQRSKYVGFMHSKSSLQTFLGEHKLSFTDSRNKKIPPAVFRLQKHLLALFLNRLFSGDGWSRTENGEGRLYGPRDSRIIGYASNSEILIRQVQHLLLRFGILSNIRKNKDCWELVVHRDRDIDIFVEEIGMFGNKSKLSKKKDSWSKVKKKGENRVVYETIKSITKLPVPEFVYDLTVEDTHNFVANDFFVHNTYIVNAIAGEAKSNVIIARVNQIVDMYTGNTEKNLHALFEQARKNPPCIIFFDELDSLGGKRGGGDREGGSNNAMRLAVNQFLVEMNGVEENPSGLFVIGATNNPWDIDPALKRSGRFSDAIYIPPPKYGDRKGLFEFYTKNTPRGSLSYGRLSRATSGFAPSDIQHICDRGVMRPLLHEYSSKKSRKLTMTDLMAVMREKDFRGSSLDEWYSMVKKDVVSKTETQTVNGKKQEIVKEGKLDAQEKVIYKTMVRDIKRNTSASAIRVKRLLRWWAIHAF